MQSGCLDRLLEEQGIREGPQDLCALRFGTHFFFGTFGQLIRDVCQTKDINCPVDFLFIHTLSRLL